MIRRTIGFRIFRPADTPNWLTPVLDSTENLFRSEMPGPFKVWGVATTDLPPAGAFGQTTNAQGLIYNLTTTFLGYSDGTDWNFVFGAGTNVADARTNLGLVAGGSGDIWVEKAGDQMSGPLAIAAGAAGAGTTYLTLLPTDFGVAKPGIFIGNPGTASWDIASLNNAFAVFGAITFRADSFTLTGLFTVAGAAQFPIRTITATASALATDYTILCDATSGAITVNLPAAAGCSGRLYNVKKIDASVNNVTIDGNSTETIDGVTTKVISAQYASFTIQSNGTAWFVL